MKIEMNLIDFVFKYQSGFAQFSLSNVLDARYKDMVFTCIKEEYFEMWEDYEDDVDEIGFEDYENYYAKPIHGNEWYFVILYNGENAFVENYFNNVLEVIKGLDG